MQRKKAQLLTLVSSSSASSLLQKSANKLLCLSQINNYMKLQINYHPLCLTLQMCECYREEKCVVCLQASINQIYSILAKSTTSKQKSSNRSSQNKCRKQVNQNSLYIHQALCTRCDIYTKMLLSCTKRMHLICVQTETPNNYFLGVIPYNIWG